MRQEPIVLIASRLLYYIFEIFHVGEVLVYFSVLIDRNGVAMNVFQILTDMHFMVVLYQFKVL